METNLQKPQATRAPSPTQNRAQLLPVMPRTDIHETDAAVIVRMEVPGVRESDVEITLEKNTLTVVAERPMNGPDGYELLHREWRGVRFERSFSLSFDFERDKLEATLKHGVLTLNLQKAEAMQPKKIAVKAG